MTICEVRSATWLVSAAASIELDFIDTGRSAHSTVLVTLSLRIPAYTQSTTKMNKIRQEITTRTPSLDSQRPHASRPLAPGTKIPYFYKICGIVRVCEVQSSRGRLSRPTIKLFLNTDSEEIISIH